MDPSLKTMIANMPVKTGKSLEEWKEILNGQSFSKHSEALKFLKEKHGVSHGFANTIALLSREEEQSPEELLAAQYKGKETLLPVYESLVDQAGKLGDDVKVIPKKSTVSLVRSKQFALIKPASKSRIDLGLKLRDVAVEGRLEDSGPFGSMCTHRVRLSGTDEIDAKLIGWIRQAYEQAL